MSNSPQICNNSQFYGFAIAIPYHVYDAYAEGLEREANTEDIEFIEIKDIQTPKLLENATQKD